MEENNHFSDPQYKKYCNVVDTMKRLAEKLGGTCQTFPFDDEHDLAYVVGHFPVFILSEEELNDIKRVIGDLAVVTIDKIEDEVISIFAAVKRH